MGSNNDTAILLMTLGASTVAIAAASLAPVIGRGRTKGALGLIILLIGLATLFAISFSETTLYQQKPGKITALIYREAYTIDGAERPEGWFIKIGDEAPAKITTTVNAFAVPSTSARFVAYVGTPAATMRASLKGLADAPVQVCTGSCDGLAAIPSDVIVGKDGVVLADLSRVQGSALGQPALGIEAVTAGKSVGERIAIGSLLALACLVFSLAARVLTKQRTPAAQRPGSIMSAQKPALRIKP
jgi:hypothetical protein